eukprot:TRINITY_DN366_c6_g1_i1.p1 TRINITY_DN366_c6_g1~~TRINITY_DN366_c6_g1_i1.p1  ORF type:complete len:336 (+),score=105.43 TRINITY_DN366_c6_g1_i1:156-1163(+)
MGTRNEEYIGRLMEDVREVGKEVKALHARGRKLKKDMSACYREQDAVAASVTKIARELSDLSGMIRRCTYLTDSERATFREEVSHASGVIEELRQRFVPQTGSLFVRLILGHVNVKVLKQGDKFMMKQEYEKFKGRTNWFLILGGLVQLFRFPGVDVVFAAFQIWMLYYYITLALREHILKVNGSHIKSWWLIHHYVSIALGFALLTWSVSEVRYHLMRRFAFCIFVQGIVQTMMHRYQLGRLYAKVATGEARSMDVTGELMNPRYVPSLSVLLPFLITAQLLQVYTGSLCWSYFLSGAEFHTLLVGAFAITLGVGNLSTTILTYYQKWEGQPEE